MNYKYTNSLKNLSIHQRHYTFTKTRRFYKVYTLQLLFVLRMTKIDHKSPILFTYNHPLVFECRQN